MNNHLCIAKSITDLIACS